MSIFLQLYLDFYEYGNRDELSNFSFTIFTVLDEYKNKTEYHEYDFFFLTEGNGNPLQCSCLENPRDGRAWWAAVYGVAESDTTDAT